MQPKGNAFLKPPEIYCVHHCAAVTTLISERFPQAKKEPVILESSLLILYSPQPLGATYSFCGFTWMKSYIVLLCVLTFNPAFSRWSDLTSVCNIRNLTVWCAAKSLQSCLTRCDPIKGSPLGTSVPGILHARTLEWVAISFSNAWKWKVKVKSLSRAWLLATPWTAAYQTS